MSLRTLWFIVDAIFWIGFFVLEGFDFGVGMLHSYVGRNDAERRIAVNSIGPVWDGNEVCLIVAGAVIFAAFPSWYATMFSTFYLAMVLILVGLFMRGVSFEYQRKIDDPRWRSTWRWCLTIGSALIPLLLGVALGDLLHGLPINRGHQYTGSFWGLLVPFGLFTGLTFLVLSLLSGATFLALKTTGELHDRVMRFTRPISIVAVLAVFGFITWCHVGLGEGFLPNPFEVLAFVAVVAAAWLATRGDQGWAFAAASVAMAASVATIFIELYPNVMISTTNAAYNITVDNAASGSYALKVMTVVAVIFFPLVLIYQAWNYHVFRGRLSSPSQSDDPKAGSHASAGSREAQPEP